MKICIDKNLFWNFKFYDSHEENQNVFGYVFQGIDMNGGTTRENWREHSFGMLLVAHLISSHTCDLWQQAFV